MNLKQLSAAGIVVMAISGLVAAAGEEPSEAQMKGAALYAVNHPPGITNSEPITIKFFKKGGCENPTPRGYRCSFDWEVASANSDASMYNSFGRHLLFGQG